MRDKPKLSMPPEVVPVAKSQENEVITQVREYKLITPLFGGGVTAGEIDPVTPIRGTEIRGQLRFWWRACRGGQFEGNLQEMKKVEDVLWGKAYKKGDKIVKQEQLVQISVEISQVGRAKAAFEIKDNKPRRVTDIPPYAAFPIQPEKEELKKPELYTKKVQADISFKLTISFPLERSMDVESSLWAWENFGGVGARTRRGFGALRCVSIQEGNESKMLDLPPSDTTKFSQWLQQKLKNHVVVNGTWPKDVPHLSQNFLEKRDFKVMMSAEEASISWNFLINKLKDFRQKRRKPQQQQGGSQGRSEWPEPSTIRNLTGQVDKRYTTPIPNPSIEKFPRAVFGLPIIFQFKDNDNRHPALPDQDPRKTSLQPQQSERFASPLILKPVACTQNRYIGLALVLQGTRLNEELVLKTLEKPDDEWKVTATFANSEVLTLSGNTETDKTRIDKQTNALQAFMKYL